MDNMDEKEIKENLKKLKALEERLFNEVLNYTLKALSREEDFDKEINNMVTVFSSVLSSIFVSAAVAHKLDKEKFAVSLDKFTNTFKIKAHKDYDVLNEIKETNEGPEDI